MDIPVPSASETPLESNLQKELRLFRELFSRLIDAFLNRVFDLRPEKASRRLWYLIALFLLSSLFLSFLYFPPLWWGQRIQDVFKYFLDPDFAESYPGNAFVNLFILSAKALFDPRVFQYFPIFLASFFIALQCAALYLADIFELEHPSVARRFLWAVALTGSEETLRVSQGDVAEDYRSSPTYLIGGPGKVIVDLDSVALFEKPDGTPRVIGPTAKEPRGRAPLEGFERFRQAIDIRDHYVDLRDQDPRARTVKSRSLDGIEINATDVRLMFSIYRGGRQPTAEQPYPFSKQAAEQIIYKATSRVTPELANPSTYEFSWVNKMISLIRNELGAFMSRHRLSAYLASIGIPEIEKWKQREEAIIEQAQKLTQSEQDFLGLEDHKNLPEFQSRYKITNLFTQFAEEFPRKAQSSGVELHWIGVGTWITPVELIPERHLEAWKLSNENLYRESDEVLRDLEKEAILQKTVSLIQDVPVAAYRTAAGEDPEHKKAVRALLLAYHQQLMEAAEFMRAKGEAVPPNIEEAVAHINNMFGHFL
jgi:hypothetical protein